MGMAIRRIGFMPPAGGDKPHPCIPGPLFPYRPERRRRYGVSPRRRKATDRTTWGKFQEGGIAIPPSWPFQGVDCLGGGNRDRSGFAARREPSQGPAGGRTRKQIQKSSYGRCASPTQCGPMWAEGELPQRSKRGRLGASASYAEGRQSWHPAKRIAA